MDLKKPGEPLSGQSGNVSTALSLSKGRASGRDSLLPTTSLGKVLLALLLIIAVFHAAGFVARWYWTVWWYDIPLHFAGGAWVALLFFYLFVERFPVVDGKQYPWSTFLLALGFVALVGTLWEFYEFLYDTLIAQAYGFLEVGAEYGRLYLDTLKDLFNDLVGGGVVVLIRWLRG